MVRGGGIFGENGGGDRLQSSECSEIVTFESLQSASLTASLGPKGSLSLSPRTEALGVAAAAAEGGGTFAPFKALAHRACQRRGKHVGKLLPE